MGDKATSGLGVPGQGHFRGKVEKSVTGRDTLGAGSLKNDVLPTTYLGGDWELSTGSLHWRPLRSHDGIVSMGQRVRLEWAETQEWSQGAQAKLLTRLWCSRERVGRYRRKEVG